MTMSHMTQALSTLLDVIVAHSAQYGLLLHLVACYRTLNGAPILDLLEIGRCY